MAARRWILFLLAAAILALAGCNSGSTFVVQNQPAPPPSNLSICFTANCSTSDPPAGFSVAVNGTLNLTATVQNDPNNLGVDWNMTCSVPNNCGSLTPLHTDSCPLPPAPPTASCIATYQPPLTLYGNTQTANIMAFATADHTKNAYAPVAVTAFDAGNIMAGNYVLQAQGVDNGGSTNYQFVGVIVLDGNGNITGGEQTINYYDANPKATPNGAGLVSTTDPITGGNYFLGPDGRGTILINTGDTDIGYSGNASQKGVETFTFVFLNSSHSLLAQMDLGAPGTWPLTPPALAVTGATATGTMDLQASTVVAPTGSYAFVASGSQILTAATQGSAATFDPVAFGGVLNISSNTILTSGSVIDQVLPGPTVATPLIVNTDAATVSTPSGQQGITGPDKFGMVTLNLTANLDAPPPPNTGTCSPTPIPTCTIPLPTPQATNFTFTGYIVDGSHIKLIESDLASSTPFAATAGQAIAQTVPSGGFSDTSFSGTYVFGVAGFDLGNPALYIPPPPPYWGSYLDEVYFSPSNTAPNTMTSAGIFTADSTGGITGNADTLLQQWTSTSGTQGKAWIGNDSGSYPTDDSLFQTTGRIPAATFGPNTNYFMPQFYFYLTGTDAPILFLEAGIAPPGANATFPFLGAGIAYPQVPSPIFTSSTGGLDYGFNFTQFNGSENDGTAQMTASEDLTNPKKPDVSLNGVADFNIAFSTNPLFTDQPFTNDPSLTISPPSKGLLHGNLVNNSSNSSDSGYVFPNTILVDFFLIDGSLGNPGGFLIETDLVNANAQQNGQVSFGYYAARAPVTAPTPTTTALTSSPNPSNSGQPVTFTATVAPANGSGMPTGTVSFAVGTAPLCSNVSLSSAGLATCNYTFTLPNSYSITATYSGDQNFSGSSASLTQTVNPAN